MELKKINEDLIVRAARAKLSAKDKKINFQGIDEKGPVQAILDHGKYDLNIHRFAIETIKSSYLQNSIFAFLGKINKILVAASFFGEEK